MTLDPDALSDYVNASPPWFDRTEPDMRHADGWDYVLWAGCDRWYWRRYGVPPRTIYPLTIFDKAPS